MAAKKKTALPANSEELATAYYDGMSQSKVAAGLPLTDAIDVTTRQRAEDEANGLTPWLTEQEAEPETQVTL